MATILLELIKDLKIDSNNDSLSEIVAERAIIRALPIINMDVNVGYQIFNDNNLKEIRPVMTGLHKELLLMRALAYLVRINTGGNTAKISFKSGDKQVTRTSTNWKSLEKTILDEYYRLLNRENPTTDSGFLKLNVKAAQYITGSFLE